MSMYVFWMNMRFRRVSVINFLFVVLLATSTGCYSQVKSEPGNLTDTVFLLFERTGNKILEVGEKVYHKPELKYPRDISREYVIRMSKLCVDCEQSARIENVSVMLSFDAAADSSFHMSRKEFLKKNYLDQDWFNSKSMAEIEEVLKDKTLYLADQGFLYDDNYILLKVDYYDFTQQ